jgi:hypothetical protein
MTTHTENLSIEKLNAHMKDRAAGGTGRETEKAVQKAILDHLSNLDKKGFIGQLIAARSGRVRDENDNVVPALDLSANEWSKSYFGADFFAVLREIGIFSNNTIAEAIGILGGDRTISKEELTKACIEHGQYNLETVSKYAPFRFIIPELFLELIRTGYAGGGQWRNWVATQVALRSQKANMPYVNEGDMFMRYVDEGADIPFGTLDFNNKEVKVFKVGRGFKISDELIQESTIALTQISLGVVGNHMNLQNDALAMDVLVNGEQAGGDESCAVVGIDNTTDGFKETDMDMVKNRMSRLGYPATRIIAQESDLSYDLNRTLQSRDRSTIGSYTGLPTDANVLPANHLMFINTANALAKLSFGAMRMEQSRNPKNQTNELFVSDFSGFAIILRGARVMLRKDQTIGAAPFPSWLDVDAYLQQLFKFW